MGRKTIAGLVSLLFLPALGAAGAASPALASRTSGPGAPDAQVATGHVWTNSDIDKLKGQDDISLVGPEPTFPSAQASTPSSVRRSTTGEETEGDLDRAETLLLKLQGEYNEFAAHEQALEDARSFRITQPGVNLAAGNIGITPEAGLDILTSQMRNTEDRLDALTGAARRAETF